MNRVLLEENGYEVRVAHSGRQCREEVAAHRPDLIILDMVMESPSDGFDVSRELRNSEYTKSIPLVMITSVNDSIPFRIEPDRTWLPVDALLEKPVDPQLLLAVVDKALKPTGDRSGPSTEDHGETKSTEYGGGPNATEDRGRGGA
jgi:CheY-like chemotaxis protein